MIGWTIHEVAAACRLTEHEVSAWISRGRFRPSANAQSGQRRLFDWRDLACLAVMSALREQSISMGGIAMIAADLRDGLDRMDAIVAGSGLYLYYASDPGTKRNPTGRLANTRSLCEILHSRPTTIIVVNVAKIYHDAADAISSNSSALPQKRRPTKRAAFLGRCDGQSRMA